MKQFKNGEYPKPWTVKVSVLRPKPFNQKIVEIHSADGDTPLPWGAFDADGRSFAKRVRLARRIVSAVNSVGAISAAVAKAEVVAAVDAARAK